MNKLELLDTDLLNTKEFVIVNYWLKVFSAEIGWHYYLDLIWQLREIEKLNLPSNAVIVDAGAGNGIMQFILASLGHNILSIDFNNRKIPKHYSKIFNISVNNKQIYNNDYVKHLHEFNVAPKKSFFKLIKYINRYYIFEYFKTLFTQQYGNINYITADFSNLDFLEKGGDLVLRRFTII